RAAFPLSGPYRDHCKNCLRQCVRPNSSYRVAYLPTLCKTMFGCPLHVAATGQAMVGPPRGKRAPMDDDRLPPGNLPRAQVLAERAFTTLQRFLHVEAVGGALLVIAATIALVWANSPFAHSYRDLWHLPLSVGLGELI